MRGRRRPRVPKRRLRAGRELRKGYRCVGRERARLREIVDRCPEERREGDGAGPGVRKMNEGGVLFRAVCCCVRRPRPQLRRCDRLLNAEPLWNSAEKRHERNKTRRAALGLPHKRAALVRPCYRSKKGKVPKREKAYNAAPGATSLSGDNRFSLTFSGMPLAAPLGLR